jgi:acyl-CoA reductase-like NAD-dependent aldehyde dehydrogenase
MPGDRGGLGLLLQGALLNNGQVCAAYIRFYVDERRVDEFTETKGVWLTLA